MDAALSKADFNNSFLAVDDATKLKDYFGGDAKVHNSYKRFVEIAGAIDAMEKFHCVIRRMHTSQSSA